MQRILVRGAILVALIVAAALVLAQQPRGTVLPGGIRSPGTTPRGSVTVAPSPQPTPASPVVAVSRSAVFDPQLSRSPTASSGQSKVWFAEGSWWGLLLAGAELHIQRLDWAAMTWADTGTLVDERPSAQADALWAGSHLYVASSPTSGNRKEGLRLLRFSYDVTTSRFELDADYPLLMTAVGVDRPILSRDSKGVLWLTFLAPSPAPPAAPSSPRPSATPARTAQVETIWLAHSTTDDLHWTAPAPAPLGSAASAVTQYAAIASGTQTDLAWTVQDADVVYTARHADGGPAGAWTVVASPFDGAAGSDQGIALRSLAGDPQQRLFVGLVDALDRRPNVNQLWVRTVLLVVRPDGTAPSYAVGLVQDREADPVILIDPIHRWLSFLTVTPGGGGEIVMKSTSIDAISFASGPGEPLVASATDPSVDGPTTSKQDPTSASGMLVLAADGGTGHYLTAGLGTGGPVPGQAAAGPTPKPLPPATTAATLLDDTFDAWAIGQPVPNGWVLQGLPGLLRVVAQPSATDRSAELRTVDATLRARACKSTPVVVGATLTATATVRVGAVASGAATVLALRSGAHDALSLRFTGHGRMSYAAGPNLVDTTVAYRVGAWYRITVTVHVAAHRYDLGVEDVASGHVVLGLRDVPLATSTATSINGVCFATSNGAPGLTLDVSQVSLGRP